jgi:ABC-type bacteriocin/lantibiotic exporter with double-glycine peptidase domain/CRP-like cAMP-binding protein
MGVRSLGPGVRTDGSLDGIEAGNRKLLEDLPLLKFLPGDARARVIRRFVPTSFPFGCVMAAEGAPIDGFYVLASGRARIVKRSANGDEIALNTLDAGDSVGEADLLEGDPRPSTVRASSDVLALRLDATDFRTLVDAYPDIRTYLRLQRKHTWLQAFFRHLPPFARLPPAAVVGVVLAELEPIALNPGAIVYEQGDRTGPMYLIEEGRLRVMRSDHGRAVHVAALAAGETFGVVSALRGAPRTTTVEAVTPVRLRALSGETLEYLASALPRFSGMLNDWAAQHDYCHGADAPIAIDRVMPPAAPNALGQDQDEQPEDDGDRDPVDAPFAEHGRFFKGHRRARVRFIQQVDAMDCGAACLAMVARAFGRRVSLARTRQLVNAGPDGASLRSICRGGEELGLATRSVKTSARHLDHMPLPAIVHWDEHHWIVLAAVDREHVQVVDPAVGGRRLTREAFERRWSGYAALFDYTPALEQASPSTRTLAWMWPLVRPHATLLLEALGLAVVVSVLQMVLPVFTQVIVDRVLVDQDLSLLHLMIGAMGATMCFIVLSLGLQRYLLSFSAVRIDAAALDFLTQRLLALPMSYFASRRTGDLQRRLEGIRQVRDFLVQHGISGITAIAQLTATVALMAFYSPWLMLVFLATSPLYALLMIVAARVLRPVFLDLEDSYSKYHSYQIDAIKGIETVKALGGESAFRRLLLDQFLGVSGKIFKTDFTATSYEGGIDAVTFLGLGLFLWAATYQVLDGQLSIGGLVAFNSLVALSTAPIRNLLLLWDNLQRCDVLLNRLDDVFQHAPEQGRDRSALRPVRTLSGSVTLRGVGFRYGGPEATAILAGVTVDVPAGTVVAIVGRSGSGKTTLARCMAGLLEPTEGAILYDGLDLKTLNYRDLRARIGFVLQDCYVFADTIARNIAFGEEEPDPERVIWAAQVASAHEFIERLPFGYETRIGETGLALSGGQRQRIAIARAIYHRPPILIFDEATSSLDAEAERAVQHNIDALLEGRTAFVIAHRVSTVQNADLIVVLDGGRLVEQGNHATLMRRRGLYYSLVSQQLGTAG